MLNWCPSTEIKGADDRVRWEICAARTKVFKNERDSLFVKQFQSTTQSKPFL